MAAARAKAPTGRSKIGWFWWLLLAVALLSGVIWVVWWETADRVPRREGALPVGALVAEPEQYVGQRVAVVGVVGQRYSLHTFSLADEAGAGEVLVIKPDGLPVVVGALRIIGPGDVLRVSGLVLRTDLAGLERAAGRQLDPAVYLAWEGRPALVAERIIFVE